MLRSRRSTTCIRTVRTVRPDAPDGHRLANSLDLPPPGIAPPVVAVFDRLPNVRRRQHAARPRQGGDPARQVYGVAVPVAAALEHGTGGDSRAQGREIDALLVGGVDQAE